MIGGTWRRCKICWQSGIACVRFRPEKHRTKARLSPDSIAPRCFGRLAVMCVLCMCSGGALALDPALDLTQYAHTAWRIRDGFSKGFISSFAQTADGYLWLGTQNGLNRFDGVRNVPWQPPPGASLPDERVRVLLVGRDGTLWIGTARGLASWREGALVTYPQLNGKFITGLVEGDDGKIWVGAVAPKGLLCAIQHGRSECHGEDGRFGSPAAVGVYKDSKSVVWVGGEHAVWQWTPGPPVRHAVPGLLPGRKAMSETGSGALLVLTAAGIRQLADGVVKPFVLPNMGREVNALSLLRDRDGAHWIGTTVNGLLHVHEGRVDSFGRSNGLSGDRVFNLFEDREGNIWATTTDGGIDRFRAFATTTYSLAQGLPTPVYSVVADDDGSIWLNTSAGLYQSRSDGIRAVLPLRRRSVYSGGGYSLFRDRSGRIWMGGESGLGTMDNGRFVKVHGIPPGIVQAITQDNKGDVWVAHMRADILRVSSDGQVHRVPWAEASQAGRGSYWSMTADPVLGGVWIGVFQTIAHFIDGELRVSHNFADTLGKARITSLRAAADGTLWVATDAGLMRLKSGRVSMLNTASGLLCDQVDSTIEDDQGSLWLYTPCGIVSVWVADLAIWSRSIDAGRAPLPIRSALLDVSDGVRFDATPITGPYGPHIAKSRDGRLWFVTFDGIMVVDPRRPSPDKLTVPVHVEQIAADRKAYEPSSHVRLPALVRDLQIDYTATTLSTPERTLFRYKLESHDREWQDAGTRRQAFYNSLPPGNYRFRVIASNKNGMWNEEGATLDFSIAPAYWQTWWFRALCVVAVLIAAWSVYRRRMRQIARQFDMTLEARVAERTRIARDLHDTLLQSFHGLLLRFQTAFELLPDRPTEARQLLASSIDQAAEAITEGRDAVQGLRASTTDNNDLAAAIRTLGQELAASQGADEILRFEVQGTPRNLHPELRDQIFRIAGEALRNAFRHAHAKHIEVELRYDPHYLRLRVRDDGKGVDPSVLQQGDRERHFGIRGMRERAAVIGGKLTLWSAPNSGTEVDLNVRASRAYATSSRRSSESAEKLYDESMS